MSTPVSAVPIPSYWSELNTLIQIHNPKELARIWSSPSSSLENHSLLRRNGLTTQFFSLLSLAKAPTEKNYDTLASKILGESFPEGFSLEKKKSHLIKALKIIALSQTKGAERISAFILFSALEHPNAFTKTLSYKEADNCRTSSYSNCHAVQMLLDAVLPMQKEQKPDLSEPPLWIDDLEPLAKEIKKEETVCLTNPMDPKEIEAIPNPVLEILKKEPALPSPSLDSLADVFKAPQNAIDLIQEPFAKLSQDLRSWKEAPSQKIQVRVSWSFKRQKQRSRPRSNTGKKRSRRSNKN